MSLFAASKRHDGTYYQWVLLGKQVPIATGEFFEFNGVFPPVDVPPGCRITASARQHPDVLGLLKSDQLREQVPMFEEYS